MVLTTGQKRLIGGHICKNISKYAFEYEAAEMKRLMCYYGRFEEKITVHHILGCCTKEYNEDCCDPIPSIKNLLKLKGLDFSVMSSNEIHPMMICFQHLYILAIVATTDKCLCSV